MPPQFTRLMITRSLFTVATQIQAVVLGWQMYILTKNPLYLGFIGLAEAVPALGLALHAGALVDRSCPETVYRRVLQLSFFSALILLVSQLDFGASTVVDHAFGRRENALLLSSFLTGVARAFSQPAVYVMVPRLVPREQLSKASAWMATSLQVARISGPALGGILFAVCGVTGSAISVCAVLTIAIATTLPPALATSATQIPTKRASKLSDFFEGARFVLGHPILLPALSLDMISVLFGGVTALLPIYAAEILQIGPLGLGSLRAAPALGAAVMGLKLTSIDFRTRAGTWLMFAVFGFGISTLIFSLSSSFWLSLIALVLSGACDSISVVIRSSAVQLASPQALRGRISAVNSIFIGSSNELGELESGTLAHYTGTVPTAVAGGVACLLTVGVVSLMCPILRRLNLVEFEAAHRGD